MKSTTERRLLFALLLSALVPVIALGVLSVAAVHRMEGRLSREQSASTEARARSLLVLRANEAADRLSAFLRGREADLRTLSLLPRTAESYLAFYGNSLSPVWARGESGAPARIWVPMYQELAFLDPAGRVVAAVAEGRALTAAELLAAPNREALVNRVRALPPGEAWVSPLEESPGGFRGRLRFARAVRDAEGNLEGVATLLLDPRHLAERVSGADPLADDGTHSIWALFVSPTGRALAYPSDIPEAVRDQVMARAPNADRDVFGPVKVEDALPRYVSYAPLLLDAGPHRPPLAVGSAVLCAPAATGAKAAGVVSSLPGAVEVHIVLLTLAAVTGVALAAVLVARRMSRPWRQLQAKARAAVAPAEPPAPDHPDALGEISRSFDTLASRVADSAGQVRASEERLREFIEMNPDGIAVTDTDGWLLAFNPALCQLLRRSPEDLARTNAATLFARSGDRDLLMARLRARGRLRNYEVSLVRGDGSTFPAVLTLRLADQAGAECVDAVVRDVSDLIEGHKRDRKKTETLFRVYGELSQAHTALRRAYEEVEDQVRRKTSELREAYEALQVSDRVKTEFLMKMSHELRTPLNCIIGYSEAIIDGLDGPVTPDQAHSLGRIAESGRRLLRMIENLLDLSRLAAGHMEFACGETAVEDAVEDVLHQARRLVGDKALRVEVTLGEPLPPVWADPDRLRQVLFNLVGNAIKYTQAGHVRVEARHVGNGLVQVAVSDTGPGIAPDHLDAIFEKFVQVPGADRSGAGLGLAICREIVESMGGSIRAASRLGEGSTFTFTLLAARGGGQLSLPLAGG